MIYLFIVLFSSIFNLQAKSENELGLNFNTLSGMGINYNTEINRNFNLELSSFYFYLGENPPKFYDTYFNFGSELQYNFIQNSNIRTYSLIGFSYWNINQHYAVKVPVVNGSPVEENIVKKNNIFNYGIGLGNEFFFSENFSLSVSLSYQFQNNNKSKLDNFLNRNPNGKNHQGLGYGISFRYRF